MTLKALYTAERSFNHQCDRASKCRHRNYMPTCFSCPLYANCVIQRKINNALDMIKQASEDEQKELFFHTYQRA